jgi:hypothetical protein
LAVILLLLRLLLILLLGAAHRDFALVQKHCLGCAAAAVATSAAQCSHSP